MQNFGPINGIPRLPRKKSSPVMMFMSFVLFLAIVYFSLVGIKKVAGFRSIWNPISWEKRIEIEDGNPYKPAIFKTPDTPEELSKVPEANVNNKPIYYSPVVLEGIFNDEGIGTGSTAAIAQMKLGKPVRKDNNVVMLMWEDENANLYYDTTKLIACPAGKTLHHGKCISTKDQCTISKNWDDEEPEKLLFTSDGNCVKIGSSCTTDVITSGGQYTTDLT